jgi:putative PEP-CTERM system TPR-repeat lipoprotein
MKSAQSALLALAICLAGCGRDDPAALLVSAKEYIAKRDFNASIIQLKNSLQKNPENAEARYLLGLSSLENGDAATAEMELNKAVALGLASDEVRLTLARALLGKEAHHKVVTEFGSATLSSPKTQAELRAVVGTSLLGLNRREQANKAFNDALSADSANVTAAIGMARLEASAGDFASAVSRVDAALRASPARLDALLLKADLHAAGGQKGEAEKAYRAAVAVAPKRVAPRLRLATHLMRSGALDKASIEVDALAKMAPQDRRTSYAQAVIFAEQRKFAAAREAILQVLKAEPNNVPSLTLAGMAALQTGAYAEAESHLRKALFTAPDALGAKRLLATTYLRMGRTDAALKEVRGLLATAGDDPENLALAGETYLASGNVASAARHYERANALVPDNAALQTRLAQVRFAAGDDARAIAELESASASRPNEYQADLALISNYLRQRQPDKALQALKSLEKKQPENPLTHHLRGLCLLAKKDFPGAREGFERALKLLPAYMPAVTSLAELDLRDKNAEAAKRRYASVLEKQPNNEQALAGLAVLLRVTGAPKPDIEKLLVQSVAGNPSSQSARATLINFYLGGRDHKAALAAAREAHAALPASLVIVEALGMAQLASTQTRQAIATFTRLAEMRPGSPGPHMMLATAYRALNEPDKAINALRAALALQPDSANLHREMAAVYIESGRRVEAVRQARELQAKDPKRAFGHVLEGDVYALEKNWDAAERTYRNALKKFDVPVLVTRLHAAMEAAGKPAEAEAMAQSWVNAHPKDAAVLSYLAERDLAAKRYAGAAERFQAALEREPDNPLLLNNLAWAANELQQPRALEYAQRANELAPDNPAIMDTLGWIFTSQGQSERGLELLGRAAELAPGSYDIRLHLAKALIQAGRKDAARKELEVLAKMSGGDPLQQEAAALLRPGL